MVEGPMRPALLLLIVAGACRGRTGREAPPPPPANKDAGVVAPVAPPDLARAKLTLGCLFDKAQTPRQILDVLAEDAPVPVVRMAALAAVERARLDGESRADQAIADAITVFTAIDDFDGLRTAFAMVDREPGPRSSLFFHDAPARARVGARSAKDEIAVERLGVVRETALAGDLPAAMQLHAEVRPTDIDDTYEQVPYVGALVALGKIADARGVIAKAKPDERLALLAVWLDTVLRQGVPAKDAIDAVLAELKTADERAAMFFPEDALFRRARRAGRGGELLPIYRALKARLATTSKTHEALVARAYDLAAELGDAPELKALSAETSLADRITMRTGPLDAALATAVARKYPLLDLVRLWTRSIGGGADPAFGARLAAAACPPPAPPRAPATAAMPNVQLRVTVVPRGKRQECALHDVVVELRRDRKVLGQQVLDGECKGACTAEEKRNGKAELARIQKAIDSGEASESETDYNFTDCVFSGPNPGRIDRVGDRDVALLVDHYIGAHDVDKDRYRLAVEVCGDLYVSDTFGGTYAGSWRLDELRVRASSDGSQLVVDGKSDRWTGVVFRLTLPTCPGVATGQALDTE
jgi:hypothetical protein